MAAFRALLRVHAAAFSNTALPLLIGLFFVGAIVLGPNGLDPRDVVRAMHHDGFVHVSLIAAWMVLARPPSQVQLLPPGSTWTRTAPIALPVQWVVVLSFASLVQAPMIAVMGKGGGLREAVPMWFLGVSLGMAPSSGFRGAPRFGHARLSTILTASAVVAQVLVVPSILRSVVAAIACVVSLTVGFRDAPLRTRSSMRLRIRLPAMVALGLAQARVLLRDEGARVARTTLFGSVVAAFVVMQVRAEPSTAQSGTLTSRVIVAASVVSLLAIGTLVRSVGRTRRRLAPLVRGTGRSTRGSFTVAALVATGPAFVIASAFGAALHRFANVGIGRAAMTTAIFMLVCVTLTTVGARIEERLAARRRDDATRWVLVSIGLGTVGSLCATSPTWLLPVLGILAVGVMVGAIVLRDADAVMVPLARD